jgi:hypothetical protein
MQQKGFSQLALPLSLLLILLVSLAMWIFIKDASIPHSLKNQHPAVAELGPAITVQPTTATDDTSPVAVNSQNEGVYPKSSTSEASAVISKLIARQWVFADTSFQAGGFRLVFSRDGTFIRSVVSDYTENRRGIWNYKEIGRGVGLLFMLTKADSSAAPDSGMSEEVFRIGFIRSGLLQLGRYSLRPDQTPPGQTDQVRSSSIKDIVNEKNFPTYFHLTSGPWIKMGTKDNNFIPDLLTLQGNGTFTGSYRKVECRHDGYWNLEKSQIFLEFPKNDCDTRGYQDPIVRGNYYRFENGSLILDRTYRYSASE